MLYGGIRGGERENKTCFIFQGHGGFPHLSGLIPYWHLTLDSATRCGGGKDYASFGELD